MNRKRKMLIGAVSIAIVSLAVTFVTASPRSFNTPLYTVRMEQASSKMNFLPGTMNNFTYTTEKGYTMDIDASREWYSGFHLFLASEISCPTVYMSCGGTCSTCDSCLICPTDYNCPTEGSTCEPTECGPNTCMETQCDRTCYGCG